MPRHCTLKEPISVAVEAPFSVNENGNPLFECLRLLMGTLDLKDKKTGKIAHLRHCYVMNKTRKLGKSTIKSIVSDLFDDDLSVEDVKKFLLAGSRENKQFWEDLQVEICFCIEAIAAKKYIEAFLYLYRLLEHSSIALPLVYAASEPDYRKALDFIKSLANNPRDGDLAIFSSFIQSAERSGGYSGLYFDFSIEQKDVPWRKELIKQLNNYVFQADKISYRVEEDETQFSIAFASMPAFLVTCRNRLFHNVQSGQNFRLDPLFGASGLCEVLVAPSMSWFSLVLIEIVKAHAGRYV